MVILTHFMPLIFLYTLWFSDVFWCFQGVSVAWNGLITSFLQLTYQQRLFLIEEVPVEHFYQCSSTFLGKNTEFQNIVNIIKFKGDIICLPNKINRKTNKYLFLHLDMLTDPAKSKTWWSVYHVKLLVPAAAMICI